MLWLVILVFVLGYAVWPFKSADVDSTTTVDSNNSTSDAARLSGSAAVNRALAAQQKATKTKKVMSELRGFGSSTDLTKTKPNHLGDGQSKLSLEECRQAQQERYTKLSTRQNQRITANTNVSSKHHLTDNDEIAGASNGTKVLVSFKERTTASASSSALTLSSPALLTLPIPPEFHMPDSLLMMPQLNQVSDIREAKRIAGRVIELYGYQPWLDQSHTILDNLSFMTSQDHSHSQGGCSGLTLSLRSMSMTPGASHFRILLAEGLSEIGLAMVFAHELTHVTIRDRKHQYQGLTKVEEEGICELAAYICGIYYQSRGEQPVRSYETEIMLRSAVQQEGNSDRFMLDEREFIYDRGLFRALKTLREMGHNSCLGGILNYAQHNPLHM